MKIKQIMSEKVISVKSDDTVAEVANIMKEYNIGFVPVVKNKKIVGVITDRDLVIRGVANNCDDTTKVLKYVTETAITINEDEEISKALEKMAEKKIKRLVVVDELNRITGIVSLSDLLESDKKKETLNTVSAIWSKQPSSKERNTRVDEFYL